jgi:hypothetical protein
MSGRAQLNPWAANHPQSVVGVSAEGRRMLRRLRDATFSPRRLKEGSWVP